MEKHIFKVGDRVFDIRFGWGEVVLVSKKIGVDFPSQEYCIYYSDAKLLSFTEYTLEGFSQERPINYEDYIGKWGKFWDNGDEEFVIGKLKKIEFSFGCSSLFFTTENYFDLFTPLTDEQIKILGLE